MGKEKVIMTRMVTTKHMNSSDILFGGRLMKWMDETSFIAATRYTRKKMVTSSVDKINFKAPVKAGTFLEITSYVKEIKGIKLKVCTEVVVEEMYKNEKRIVAESLFSFVSLNEHDVPQRINYQNAY